MNENTSGTRNTRRLYRCQKSNKDIPLDTPHCLNPKGYCRWRTACPVNLLEKESRRGNKA